MLPAPTQLTLPLCFPPALLPELQHEAIASAAAVQQQRLAGLFPGLSSSMAADGPTWLQWGFGCVRSRAFKLGPDCFASVPFLDLANHAPGQPSCDFRQGWGWLAGAVTSGWQWGGNAGPVVDVHIAVDVHVAVPAVRPSAAPPSRSTLPCCRAPSLPGRRLSSDGSAVQLVALQELAPGQEATISYTGGWVGGKGNIRRRLDWRWQMPPIFFLRMQAWAARCFPPSDRDHSFLFPPPPLRLAGADDTTNQRLMAQYGFVLPGSPADRLAFDALPDGQDGAGAPGNRHQAPLLSLDRMLDRLGERQAVVFSGQDPYAFAALKSLPFAADEGDAAELDAQLALTGQLAGELAAEAAGWPTTLDQDSRLLQGWREAAAAGSGTDARLVAAVEYRLQRKALVRTAAGLLADFTRGPG